MASKDDFNLIRRGIIAAPESESIYAKHLHHWLKEAFPTLDLIAMRDGHMNEHYYRALFRPPETTHTRTQNWFGLFQRIIQSKKTVDFVELLFRPLTNDQLVNVYHRDLIDTVSEIVDNLNVKTGKGYRILCRSSENSISEVPTPKPLEFKTGYRGKSEKTEEEYKKGDNVTDPWEINIPKIDENG
jgi:hypothetical protein